MTNQVIKNSINTATLNGMISHSGELIRLLGASPKALLTFGGMLLIYGAITYCVDSGCGVDVDLDCAGIHTGVKIHHEGVAENE